MIENANLKYVDEIAGEDLDFRKRFIQILKDEFPVERDEYEKNIYLKKYQKAHENVHKLKHKINLLSLHNAHSLAVQHEFELRNDLNNLSQEFIAVLNYMETYIKSI